jgi:hypothetical protein
LHACIARSFEQMLARISGLFSVMPQLHRSFKGSRFEQGYPLFTQLEPGEIIMRAYPGRQAAGGSLDRPLRRAAARQ